MPMHLVSPLLKKKPLNWDYINDLQDYNYRYFFRLVFPSDFFDSF